MTESMEVYTMVTGSSAGIGKAFAEECAGRGMNLLLVSLGGTGLAGVAEDIRKTHGVNVEIIEIDLCEKLAPEAVFDWYKKNAYSIDMIINNAGIGYAGRVENHSLESIDQLVCLNIRALVKLTNLFIPELKKHEKAYIMNMSSLSCFGPVPFKSIYASTKAFVYNFTRAIDAELRGTGVQASISAPGSVVTNQAVQKRIEAAGFFGKVSSLYPNQVAYYTMRKMLKGKRVIIPGRFNRVFRFIESIFPLSVRLRILIKLFGNEGVPGGKK